MMASFLKRGELVGRIFDERLVCGSPQRRITPGGRELVVSDGNMSWHYPWLKWVVPALRGGVDGSTGADRTADVYSEADFRLFEI